MKNLNYFKTWNHLRSGKYIIISHSNICQTYMPVKLSHENTTHSQDFWKNGTVPKHSWLIPNSFFIVYLNWGLRQDWFYGSYRKIYISRCSNFFPKYSKAKCRTFLRDYITGSQPNIIGLPWLEAVILKFISWKS